VALFRGIISIVLVISYFTISSDTYFLLPELQHCGLLLNEIQTGCYILDVLWLAILTDKKLSAWYLFVLRSQIVKLQCSLNHERRDIEIIYATRFSEQDFPHMWSSFIQSRNVIEIDREQWILYCSSFRNFISTKNFQTWRKGKGETGTDSPFSNCK